MKRKTLRQLIRIAIDIPQSTIGARPKVLTIAQEKRAYERELRAAGRSRAEARTMVSERYRNRG